MVLRHLNTESKVSSICVTYKWLKTQRNMTYLSSGKGELSFLVLASERVRWCVKGRMLLEGVQEGNYTLEWHDAFQWKVEGPGLYLMLEFAKLSWYTMSKYFTEKIRWQCKLMRWKVHSAKQTIWKYTKCAFNKKKIQYNRFSKAVTLNSRNIFLKIVTTMCASDKSKMKCCWVLKTTKCNLKGNQKH